MKRNNKNSFVPQTRTNDNNAGVSVYESHRHVAVGPINTGETYYKVKKLEKVGKNKPNHLKACYPRQYPSYKTGNEIKPLFSYKGSVVVFDDILGSSNSSQLDEFFRTGRHDAWMSITIATALLHCETEHWE